MTRRRSYLETVRSLLEHGPAMAFFRFRVLLGDIPDGDPAGVGWVDTTGQMAVRGRGVITPALPRVPASLPNFDDRDTNPRIHTIIGPIVGAARRPARITSTLVGLRARQ